MRAGTCRSMSRWLTLAEIEPLILHLCSAMRRPMGRRRFQFGLKSVFLACLLVAVVLIGFLRSIPTWTNRYLTSVFVENGSVETWWPDSWKSRYATLGSDVFGLHYRFDMEKDGNLSDVFRTTLKDTNRTNTGLTLSPELIQELQQTYGIHPRSNAPSINAAEWTEDSRSCHIATSGQTHRQLHMWLASIRSKLRPVTAASISQRN